jgi:hypothetical protein
MGSLTVHVVQVDASAGAIDGSVEALNEFPPICSDFSFIKEASVSAIAYNLMYMQRLQHTRVDKRVETFGDGLQAVKAKRTGVNGCPSGAQKRGVSST